jgi:hypothetical protein
MAGIAFAAAVSCLWVTGAAASSFTSGGITYVTKERHVKANHYRTLKAECPGGTHVLGGGEDSNAGFAQLRLRHTFPYDTKDQGSKPDDGWAVGVSASVGRDVDVTAICAKLKPSYRKQSFPATGLTQGGEFNVVCKGDDEVLSGGTRGPDELSQNSGFPEGDNAWGFYVDNQGTHEVQVRGYAVCADINVRLISVAAMAPPNNFDTAQASCPQHKRVVGGGQSNGAGYNRIAANRMTPVGDDGWLASVNNYDAAITFDYTAYAVCVGPLG